jgi:hypothetical protein
MAGRGTIQRYPLGLLGLVDLKDMGQGPNTFSETLQPTIDATKYYLLSRVGQNSGQAANVNATGFFAATGLLIPIQTVWAVDFITAVPSAVLGAATTTRFRLAVARSNGTSIMSFGDLASGTVGERPTANARDLYFTPGDQLGIFCESWAGVAFNVNVFLGLSALPY